MSDRNICAPLSRCAAVTAARNTNQFEREGGCRNRRGVVLLIVMVLLALMTLLGLTLVLVTAQGRLSALATSRKSLQSEHDTQELSSTVAQVVTGSIDPNSSFGAHGLLEDIYGTPQFFGQIAPTSVGTTVLPVGETTNGAALLQGVNNGTLVQLLVMAANVNPSTGAQTGLTGVGPQSALQYILPHNSGAFCGQVITMLSGPAGGHSARVVGYFFDPLLANASPPYAVMQVTSFDGIVPNPGDEFMINGRPFSGTGFGLDLTKFMGVTNPWAAPYTQPAWPPGFIGPLLTAYEGTSSPASPIASNMPYAYLPNHARIALTTYPPTTTNAYWDAAGPGGANEPYDTPDFQNMILAMHCWNPLSSSVVTPIPSMHRPELIGWYYAQGLANPTNYNSVPPLGNPSDGAGGQNMLALRRKVILRPEPTDHYFVDINANGVWDAREPFQDMDGNGIWSSGDPWLDLNGDKVWTAGETDYAGNTFNPVTGCWYITATGNWALDMNGGATIVNGLDVDNDGDTIPDSIWVDAGLPIHTEADGTFTKNLVSVLCIDLDGKVNLNAHGTLAQLDPFRYPYNPYMNTSGADNGQGFAPNPWVYSGNPAVPPVDSKGVTLQPNTITAPITSTGSTMAYVPTGVTPTSLDYNQRTLPVGQGYGPPDVNPLHLFLLRSHTAATALNYYQVFLQGFDGYPNAPGAVPPVDGRHGESARLTLAGVTGFTYPGVFPPGSALPTPWSTGTSPLTWAQFFSNGPRPGWSQWFDPYATSLLVGGGYPAYWVNDPVALARFSDIRPGLLTPPAAGSAYPVPYFFDFFTGTVTMQGGNTFPTGPATHLPTGQGTPSDLHSRGFLATDLTGRPYYAGTATFPWEALPSAWSATMTDYAVGQYTGTYSFLQEQYLLNDGVDTPYELDLRQNARQGGENTGNSVNGIPDYASVDNKLDPSELEGILRSHEWSASGAASSGNLVTRLNNLETAEAFLRTGKAPSPVPTTALGKDSVRLAVTSESSDLPVPNIALTPQQMQDVVVYTNMLTAGGSFYPPIPNLNSISLADLARARIYVENQAANTNKVGVPPIFVYSTYPYDADLALFGNLKNIRQNVTVFPTLNATPSPQNPNIPVWPLLAPEIVLGTRLDINRPLGNGIDDNGNGVVDEPSEVLWQWTNSTGVHGESLVYPYGQINATTAAPIGQINPVTGMNNVFGALDLNNDGFVAGSFLSMGQPSTDPQTGAVLPADPTDADMRARQLLARHLYVTAMLLLDDRSFANGGGGNPTAMLAHIFNPSGFALPSPSPWPQYKSLNGREQAAYVIAQWAINVVDFRDRDSIMTPFEFDLYPFRADNPAYPNVTWNVDDIVGPSSLDDTDPLGVAVASNPVRGLVWGCERPELLITETLAVHDRGTNDTSNAQVLDQNNDPDTQYHQGGPPQDQDWDQVRRPRGSLILELLNITNPSDAPQRDLQYDAQLAQFGIPTGMQPWTQVDVNGNAGYGVNLAEVATGIPDPTSLGPLASPVWRVVVAYSPFSGISTNEANYYTSSPYKASTTQPDPRVPVFPSNYIHRAIYFAPYQVSFNTPSGATGNAILVNDVLLNRSFFLDPDLFLPNPGSSTALGVNVGALMLPPSQYALVAPACADLNIAAGPTYMYKNYLGLNSGGKNANVRQLHMGFAQEVTTLNPPGIPTSITTMTDGSGVTQPGGPLPVIGVPIQTTWLDATQTYIKHNLLNISPGGNATNPYGATGTAQVLTSTLRMSVSEPEHGYPIYAQTGSAAGTGSAWDDDAYYQYGLPTTPTTTVAKFPQHPFDSGQGNPQNNNNSYLVASDLPNSYVAANGTTQSMTTCYTIIYLQRLANPLNHWDITANPYITVDYMPVDLTAYTGESATAEPQSTYTANPGSPISSFDTRRRGYITTSTGSIAVGSPTGKLPGASGEGVANLWTPLPVLPSMSLTVGQYGMSGGQGSISAPFVSATLGYTNTEYGSGVLPMPWITWNNRPFASQYELMLVPQSSPSTLVQDFGMLGWYRYQTTTQLNGVTVSSSTANGTSPEQPALSTTVSIGVPPTVTTTTTTPLAVNEYAPGAPPSAPPLAYGVLPVAQFAHLLNFFNSQQPTSGLTPTSAGTYLPNLYRLFEMVHVPSRFTGTQDMLDPSQFAGDDAALGTSVATGNNYASHLFHTPFNWLSRYREPGKVNLNTIFDPVVFKCLMDDYPGTLFVPGGAGDPTSMPSTTSLWQYLFASRQGFVTASSVLPPNPIAQFTSANALYPAYIANPFRPDGSGAFVPPTTWNQVTPTLSAAAPVSALMQTWSYPGSGGLYNGVNTTLLRPSPSLTATGLALFDDTAFDTTNIDATTGLGATYATSTNYPFRDAGVNAGFQYQLFNRLGNITTNRSNVYAIWITLGKFQVQPVGVSPTNPDGYKLVQPYLDDQGNQVVTRGFYIFDRSIPMGFQRGQDLNIEKGMLLERVLELPQ